MSSRKARFSNLSDLIGLLHCETTNETCQTGLPVDSLGTRLGESAVSKMVPYYTCKYCTISTRDRTSGYFAGWKFSIFLELIWDYNNINREY